MTYENSFYAHLPALYLFGSTTMAVHPGRPLSIGRPDTPNAPDAL